MDKLEAKVEYLENDLNCKLETLEKDLQYQIDVQEKKMDMIEQDANYFQECVDKIANRLLDQEYEKDEDNKLKKQFQSRLNDLKKHVKILAENDNELEQALNSQIVKEGERIVDTDKDVALLRERVEKLEDDYKNTKKCVEIQAKRQQDDERDKKRMREEIDELKEQVKSLKKYVDGFIIPDNFFETS